MLPASDLQRALLRWVRFFNRDSRFSLSDIRFMLLLYIYWARCAPGLPMAQLLLANPHSRCRIEEKTSSRRVFSNLGALRARGMQFVFGLSQNTTNVGLAPSNGRGRKTALPYVRFIRRV